jgi:hypothetical protein
MVEMDTEFKSLKSALFAASTIKDGTDGDADDYDPEQAEEFETLMGEIMAIRGKQSISLLDI